MVATESHYVLNRRFISDLASVVGFFNTLLGECRAIHERSSNTDVGTR